MKPFRRRGDQLVGRLVDAEAGIVGLLLDQLEQLLAADPADEEGSQLAVYYWLTAVQGSLVDALVAGPGGRW